MLNFHRYIQYLNLRVLACKEKHKSRKSDALTSQRLLVTGNIKEYRPTIVLDFNIYSFAYKWRVFELYYVGTNMYIRTDY